MDKMFIDWICDLLTVAVKNGDVAMVNAINNLFDRMRANGVSYKNLDNEGMIDFTAYLGTAIERNVDRNKLIEYIESLRLHPEKAESYYDISYLV